MSFFQNIFGATENSINKFDWINLEDIKELDLIIKDSWEKPIVIFKHSTRCSISRMALKQFENDFDANELITPYFLDLLKFRDISNELSVVFNVQHQSPQVLLVRDGICIYSETHEDIDARLLKSKI